MNQIKLFATDMDGTFLHDDRTFNHQLLREVLPKLEKSGSIFCASSGRQLLALEKMFAEFQDRMAFVAENGGIVSYKGKTIFAKALSAQQVEELIVLLQEMPYSSGYDFLISGLNGAYALEKVSDDFFARGKLYYANCQKVGAVSDIDDTLLKITTNFAEEHVKACETWLNAHASYVRATTTGFSSIDLIPDGISKASGLAYLLAHLGWHPENLAAFGDQMNDYEMLQYAGHSYAVSNAFPEILKITDNIVASNNEDGVLMEIEKILTKK